MKVIDLLRQQFPQYKWKYDRRRAAWVCEAGYAHWTCSLDEWERPSYSQLWFYRDGITPTLISIKYHR